MKPAVVIAVAAAIIAANLNGTRLYAQTPAVSTEVSTEELTINLNGWQTKAKLTYPKQSTEAVFPTVVLIHGSTPADMDFTVMGFDGKPVSRIFKDLAEYLPTQGIAVLRYNKRFVSGPGQADWSRYNQLRLPDLLADAQAVLTSIAKHPRVDAKRLFAYGWSEGSAIAGQLAANPGLGPKLRGVVLQAPVSRSFAATLAEQVTRVGLPYLRGFARDGMLSVAAVQAALAGPGGLLARGFAWYLLDPRAASPTINPYYDQNADGQLDIEREVAPLLAGFFRDDPAVLGMYASSLALPGLLAVAPTLALPVLVLHGEQDANVPVADTQALARALAANPAATVRVYQMLGHSLGPATSPLTDNFAPIAPQVMADVAAWVRELP
jgi:uncharacterized protein